MKKNHDFGHCLSNAWRKTLRVMKLTAILFFLAIFTVSAEGYSQGTRVSMKMEDASLKEVFRELKSLSDYTFVYSEGMVADVKIDEINLKDVSVEDALTSCLEGTDLEYYIENNVVVIRKKAPVYEQPVEQEKKEIKGKVTDDQGVPLPGVSVVIKGTSVGVATDIDGNYVLEIDSNNAVLVFSFVGMLPQEIAYKGQPVQNVSLTADTEQMAEVVVTGYQSISRERASGAFEKVDSEVLDQKSTLNVVDKLEGQAAGVLFDSDGNITIRGISTMKGNSKPLYVVDGFPIEGDLETLNPNDVESMTVLKDAAAASIWGARAANGVIVIVSKKHAKKGKPIVEFSSTLSIADHPDLYELPFASTEKFLEVEKFLADNGWQNLPSGANQYPITQGMDAFLKLNDGQIDQAEADAIINQFKKVDVRDEFADLFLRKSVRQQYNIAISGASDNSDYRLSLSYDDNKSSSKENQNDRLIANLKINTKITDRINVNAGISTTLRNQYNNGIGIQSILGVPQYQTILDADGNYIPQPQSYYQPTKESLVEQGYPYNWDYNLYQEFQNKDNTIKNTDIRMNVGVNVKLVDGLDFEGRYQYEWGNKEGESLYNEETYTVRSRVNTFTYIEDGKIISNFPKGHIFNQSFAKYRTFTTRGQLNFNRAFDDNKHQLNALAGMEVRKYESESSSYSKYGYDPQSLQYISVNHNERYTTAISGQKRNIGDNTSFGHLEDRFVSYYGNMAYTYNDKYTLTASARLDDSNLFGADSKYRNVPLWSTGLNWQMHKEDFINLDFVNRLNLRLTYGTNGNVDKNTSPYLIAEVTKDYRDQHQYAYLKNPKNPNLRWEKTAVVNVGVDYSLFSNRLSGSIEYYSKNSTDLLGNVSLNSTYGFSSALMNFAEMTNKGIDASVNVGVLNKGVKWNSILNFSYNKNRVEKVEMPDETVSSYIGGVARVGKPLHYMYSYRWAGLSNEGLPQIYNEKGEIIDHETQLEDPKALKYEGNLIPKFYGSWSNVIRYKGFSLSTLFTYKFGHKFRVPTINYSDLNTSLSRNYVHEDYVKRWQKPGDEAHTDIPVLPTDFSQIGSYFGSYSRLSDNRVESASHIRFKEVILNYDLPKKFVEPLKLRALNVGVQVRNLGVLTFNDSGLDPEYVPRVRNNQTLSGIPLKPEYTFSLKATF
ncbi:SusC/RagA family TonB-linked outer membrane protein [Marinifilum fragile]|uniref:SusC/RagA family TonB-linked outer membrane protein n=1 Tax=Marinifilum fragile TaxID=570161 RepID=UPI0006CFE1C9|nr:SusC/RagA family TonB-linked outer membrane protein [Marinifilum fragile]